MGKWGSNSHRWPFIRIHYGWITLGAEQRQSARSAAPGRIALPDPFHEEQISAGARPVVFRSSLQAPARARAGGMSWLSRWSRERLINPGPRRELVFFKSGRVGPEQKAGHPAPLPAGPDPPMTRWGGLHISAFCGEGPRHRAMRVRQGGRLSIRMDTTVPSIRTFRCTQLAAQFALSTRGENHTSRLTYVVHVIRQCSIVTCICLSRSFRLLVVDDLVLACSGSVWSSRHP